MGVLELGIEAMKELIPPHEGGDERVNRWRLAVAAYMGVNTLALTVHIAWACGLLTSLGLTGFARAESLDETIKLAQQQRVAIERKLDAVQLYTVQNAIKEALKTRCLSIIQNNQASLDTANRDLETLQDAYYSITRRNYNEQSCSVILISKGG